MLLILLRHADAVDSASSDYNRVLSDKGRKQAQSVGQFYGASGILPDRILSSHYPRALETAQIVASCLKGAPAVEQEQRMGCGMSIEDGREVIRDSMDCRCLLMVGHQPDFGEFAGYLLGSPTGSTLAFRKACSAVFEVHAPRSGGSILQYFVPAKLLGSL